MNRIAVEPSSSATAHKTSREVTDLTAPNARYLGLKASRQQISTPALLIDLDAFGRNLETMRSIAQAAKIDLRPHAKAHKSVEIARRQVEAGAVGLSCATLGEAETFAAAGVPGGLITSPVVTPAMISRLRGACALRHGGRGGRRQCRCIGGGVRVGRQAARRPYRPRCRAAPHGRSIGSGGVDLARRVAGSAHLRWRGVQAYWGHLQQVLGFAERRRQVRAQAETLRTAVDELWAAGLAARYRYGRRHRDGADRCGTGYLHRAPARIVSLHGLELWPRGTVAGRALPLRNSLFVRANVVSAGGRSTPSSMRD